MEIVFAILIVAVVTLVTTNVYTLYSMRQAEDHIFVQDYSIHRYQEHFEELAKENQKLAAALKDEREKNMGYSENPPTRKEL